jgi:hypothetical protein
MTMSLMQLAAIFYDPRSSRFFLHMHIGNQSVMVRCLLCCVLIRYVHTNIHAIPRSFLLHNAFIYTASTIYRSAAGFCFLSDFTALLKTEENREVFDYKVIYKERFFDCEVRNFLKSVENFHPICSNVQCAPDPFCLS